MIINKIKDLENVHVGERATFEDPSGKSVTVTPKIGWDCDKCYFVDKLASFPGCSFKERPEYQVGCGAHLHIDKTSVVYELVPTPEPTDSQK